MAPHDPSEPQALLQEVYEAFAGVSRDGGVSWTEADALDGHSATHADLESARLSDTEASWEELVEDAEWEGEAACCANWAFLDAIGFRYYLPAGMARDLKARASQGLAYYLKLEVHWRDHTLEKWSKLDVRQRRCVRDFVLFMRDNAPFEFEDWQKAYESYWCQVE